jgi:hypothetical protein
MIAYNRAEGLDEFLRRIVFEINELKSAKRAG